MKLRLQEINDKQEYCEEQNRAVTRVHTQTPRSIRTRPLSPTQQVLSVSSQNLTFDPLQVWSQRRLGLAGGPVGRGLSEGGQGGLWFLGGKNKQQQKRKQSCLLPVSGLGLQTGGLTRVRRTLGLDWTGSQLNFKQTQGLTLKPGSGSGSESSKQLQNHLSPSVCSSELLIC